MIIRIILTIIFLIIGIISYKKSIIIEKEKNPKLLKDNKLNLLTSAIPYTLSKVFITYGICLIASVLFLQSQCTEKRILSTYEITSIEKEYEENSRKNQTYIFNNNDEIIKEKNIDKLEIIEESNKMYVEKYELISTNEIINILMYGSYERGLIIYK